MSFGYSVGDFLTTGVLAWKVRNLQLSHHARRRFEKGADSSLALSKMSRLCR